MKPKLILTTLTLFVALHTSAQAPTWPETNIQTKPGARWWWMGSAVDDGNLQHLMEEYAKNRHWYTGNHTHLWGAESHQQHHLP